MNDLYFHYEGVTYSVSRLAFDLDRIVLPDSRVFDVIGWQEKEPPEPIRLEEVNPGLAVPLKPAALAQKMNAALARPLMWRAENRFLMIMDWAGVADGPNWYLGTEGHLDFIGGYYNNFSPATEIDDVIERGGFYPSTHWIHIRDETAVRMYLEGRLAIAELERATEVDGALRTELTLSGKNFRVYIRRSNEMLTPYDFIRL
jgi:hypothetical protein